MKRFLLLTSIAAAVIWLLPVAGPFAGMTDASVITTGDVDPGGAARQPDPWAVGGVLEVGGNGIGTLNVDAGSMVSNTQGYIGRNVGSTGQATVTGPGSQWNNTSWLSVGHGGYGTLNVESGGVVSNSTGFIGYFAGSTGAVTVTGSDSQWNNSSSLFVGSYGTGTLNVESGGVVSNLTGAIGLYFGSTGEVTVTGSDSQWNNSQSLYVGGSSVGSGGSGTLNIDDSGVVTVAGTTKLWSTGILNLDGGSLTTGSFDNSETGTLNFHDGTLTVNGASGVFDPGTDDFTIDGDTVDDTPHLVIADTASTTLSGNLTVGSTARGKLTVETGGVVSSMNGSMGHNSGSTGEAMVSGTRFAVEQLGLVGCGG